LRNCTSNFGGRFHFSILHFLATYSCPYLLRACYLPVIY
jgi:hypothetical protein